MNPISAFFVENIVAIFFVYGLAFFAMGLALALASRRTSEFAFVWAIRPLAAFGLLHGLHEWIEMFQKIAVQSASYTFPLSHELTRLVVLAGSFMMLAAFGLLLLAGRPLKFRRVILPMLGLITLWLGSSLAAMVVLRPPPAEALAQADVLARYSLGIPGALLGTWALMSQQRTFREHAMPQFGRDLAWCAAALFLYGIIGQLFVRPTTLPLSTYINSDLFLQWFGLPVQLFRAMMATVLTVFMMRALNAFELESQQRLAEANQAKLTIQATALEKERQFSHKMENLNKDLRTATRELTLLLELSNLLAEPMSLSERLYGVLLKIVNSLNFAEVGMILLIEAENERLHMSASFGFEEEPQTGAERAASELAYQLAEACIAKRVAMCRHLDGQIIEFVLETQERCRNYESPAVMVSLPLSAREQVIGGLVLMRRKLDEPVETLSPAEFKLMLGAAQQLGLSLENARLYQQVQERQRMLSELLHQVVGAQEAERQRIARELHDATGQSLTAMALGLGGMEKRLADDRSGLVEQVRELKTFGTRALGELRQIIADLRPSHLDDLGLAAALQWYVQEFEKRRAIPTNFVVKGERVRLPAEYETVLFRIAQEALTNIAKHAEATQAEVKLEFYPAQIVVTVSDDGRGFDPKAVLHNEQPHSGWGLLGIQERTLLLGGQCEFDSAPGQGTRLRVKIPLIMEADDVQDTPAAG